MLKSTIALLLIHSASMLIARDLVAWKDFSREQKAEWTTFDEYWKGNGRGTCIPMMEDQISKGKCTSFEFIASVRIGRDGRIKNVQITKNNIVCEDNRVKAELLKCFVTALHDDPTRFKTLRGFRIRDADL